MTVTGESLDVLAAQVRETLLTLSGHLPLFAADRQKVKRAEQHLAMRESAYAALDALVARVTEAEDAQHLLADCQRGRKAAQDEAFRRGDEVDRLTAALADARNALERVRPMAEEIRDEVVARTMEIQRARMWSRDRDPGHWTRYERHLAEAVNEVLARLDGNQS